MAELRRLQLPLQEPFQALGYKRFADLAADLRRNFAKQVTPYTVLKAATREKRSVGDRVRYSVERDTENVNVLRSSLDADGCGLAKLIHRSRRVLVVGVDLAASLPRPVCLAAIRLIVH